MKTMQTLTIGGETYAIYDPEAAHIDDTKVGDTAWSSREVVERLCPALTAQGEAPAFQPVACYPLNVVSNIMPVQGGDPTPQKPYPITGHTAVTLSLSNGEETGEFTEELGQTAYWGQYDWSAGVLTVTHKLLTLTGDESGWQKYGTGTVLNANLLQDALKGTASVYGASSHITANSVGNLNWDYIRKMNTNGGFETTVAKWGLADNEIATWTGFLKAQQEAGTPVQILYKLQTPLTVVLSDVTIWQQKQIISLPGVNTIQSSTGDTAVTYRADLSPLWEKLLNQTGIE